MSGIAGSEVILLVIIGLIVLGPKRLPQVANQVGSWLGQARRMTRMMKRQLEEEVNFDFEKELGLKEDADRKPADVSSPGYVHDRHADSPDGDVSPDAAADVAEPAADLPDDYSPAHEPEDLGTGVGDDAEYIDDDELEPLVASTDTGNAQDPVDPDTAEPDKKETA